MSDSDDSAPSNRRSNPPKRTSSSNPAPRKTSSPSSKNPAPRTSLKERVSSLQRSTPSDPPDSDDGEEVFDDPPENEPPTPTAPPPTPGKLERLKSKISCLPASFIYAVVTFVVLWLALFFFSPKIVCRKEGERYTRDNTKVFFWSLGLGVLVGSAIMVYGKMKGTGAVCVR